MLKSFYRSLRQNLGLVALSGVSFLATLAAIAPVSLAASVLTLDATSVSYRQSTGSIWQGAIEGLRVSEILIGDVDLSLSPVSVLRLSPELKFQSANGAVRGDGRILLGFNNLTLQELYLDLDAGAFASDGILGERVSGRVELSVAKAKMTKSECAIEGAKLQTDLLDQPFRRMGLAPFPLQGTLQCDGAVIVALLEGENGQGSTHVELRIHPDMRYDLKVETKLQEERINSALLLFGFEQGEESLVYGSTGVLKELRS